MSSSGEDQHTQQESSSHGLQISVKVPTGYEYSHSVFTPIPGLPMNGGSGQTIIVHAATNPTTYHHEDTTAAQTGSAAMMPTSSATGTNVTTTQNQPTSGSSSAPNLQTRKGLPRNSKNGESTSSKRRKTNLMTDGYTVACGVTTSETKIPTPPTTKNGAFHCPRCDGGFSRFHSVRDHFAPCTTKYGNPAGLKFNDHPSMTGKKPRKDYQAELRAAANDDNDGQETGEEAGEEAGEGSGEGQAE